MKRRIKATGIIIPTNWDTTGNPKDYALYTFDEKIYHLNFEFMRGNVENLLQKLIEIKGTIKKKRLMINEITILGNGVH